jgi:hypothetical protein
MIRSTYVLYENKYLSTNFMTILLRRNCTSSSKMQYPSPLCRLTWAVTHVIGLHVKLTILRECDVASTNILGILMSNIVLMVDTRAH